MISIKGFVRKKIPRSAVLDHSMCRFFFKHKQAASVGTHNSRNDSCDLVKTLTDIVDIVSTKLAIPGEYWV